MQGAHIWHSSLHNRLTAAYALLLRKGENYETSTDQTTLRRHSFIIHADLHSCSGTVRYGLHQQTAREIQERSGIL